MKIIGAPTSPYTRITRIVCDEMSLPYEFEATPPFAKLDEKRLKFIALHNPLLRVPILIDGDVEIMDSRIIVQYLLRKGGKKNSDFRSDFPASIAEDNLLTVILGVIDAGILRFIMSVAHPEINANGGYMARSLERMREGFLWLEKQGDLGHSFGVPESALIGGLEWFQKREVYSWEEFPRIAKIHDDYRDRPSTVKTRIPETV